jgi:hypothetical protein
MWRRLTMADIKFFFVCGPPKAGTTWVQHILDAHPRISCTGEGHFHTKVTLPFIEMMREYNRWQLSVDDLVYQGRSTYSPISRAEMVDVIRAHIRWLLLRRAIAQEVTWVGDKTPGYTETLADMHGLFPEARFVHVIRDPRDVAVSRLFQRARTAANPEIAVPGDPLYYQTVEEVAEQWHLGAARVKAFCRACPGVLHELRYEDLLQAFRGTVRLLLEFFAVELSPETIVQIEHVTRFEAMTGGRARGHADPGSFYRKGIAGDWLERLDDEAVGLVERRCGGWMDAYGYARSRAP